jgi:predicted amidohydrolase YtcJ
MANDRLSRREFMGITGAGLAGPLFGAASAGAQPRAAAPGADLVVINANVRTVDPQVPQAQAFAVKNGRFVAIGSTADIRGLADGGTETYDARGMTIVPGFIDCHNHASGTTLLYEVLVGNPFEVEFVTIQSIIDKLRAKARETPPGTWVEGYFFDDTKVRDGRQLNNKDLDKVSTEHPVAVNHRGGHTSYYNSKVFELAGITKDTPNPDGGTYDKDANGELNGRATDRARGALDRVGRQPTYTPEQRVQRSREGLAHISTQFVRYGLTTVHHEGGDLGELQEVRARGDLLHRVSYEMSGNVLESMITSRIRSGFGDDHIRFGATSEHTLDGSFSERTMALKDPYPNSNPPYRGNLTESQEELNEWIERVHRAGIQVNCHANGEVAIDMFLTAVERAFALTPRPDARPKITHCTLINDDLLRRMKAVDAVPALFTTYTYYNTDKFGFYGASLMNRSMAFRSMLDMGIRAAAGSDFSPGPFAPLMGIQGMVTRTGWNGETWGANQRVSVAEAVAINTINGAYNSHEETVKGSISPNKLADFVVLAEDPYTIDPSKIKDIQIVQTVVGGKVVYQG